MGGKVSGDSSYQGHIGPRAVRNTHNRGVLGKRQDRRIQRVLEERRRWQVELNLDS